MQIKYIIILFVIFFFIILILWNKCSQLKNDIKSLNQQIKDQEKRKAAYIERDNELQLSLDMHPENYFRLKNSCMNKNESRVFFYLNCALNELFPNPEDRENYLVFPQMSLYAIISTLPSIDNDKDYTLKKVALNKIGGKNVDFAICHRFKKDKYYLYRPLILIEVDGDSHSNPIFGEKKLQKQQINDAIKDNLCNALDIPLFRYVMESNQITYDDRYKIKTELCQYLHKAGIFVK